MVICLERGAELHMSQLTPLPLTVSCSSKIQIGFTFLVPAHLGSPRQRAVKQMYVGMFMDQPERRLCTHWHRGNKCIAVRKVATPLRELTCHMASHSVICHLAEVTFPPLLQPKLVLD